MLSSKDIQISDHLLFDIQRLNANVIIFSQWDHLEKTGCINNFRIIADHNNNFFREGYFFADSDAYKWLDAACRIQQLYPNDQLLQKINYLIDLIVRTQEPDGYIFTYNQIHFSRIRWKNLLLEHELYCMGHLIEAGVSHYQINQDKTLLSVCEKVAGLLIYTFLEKKLSAIPGHEELELALLKLYSITEKEDYLNLVNQFIGQRGKISFIGLRFLRESISTGKRMNHVQKLRKKFYIETQIPEIVLPDNVSFSKPKGIKRKSFFNFYSGKYIQSHKSIRNQLIPEGHAVRFGYLMTACTMYSTKNHDDELIQILETSWQHMITKRMFVTGGIGQIPVTEGFDTDYQLNPNYAYCESCAGIGSLLWSWQMTLVTHKACYADLFEWQLYNAVLVGLSEDGQSYFYRNPLEIKTEYGRKEWYKVACCPSNLSRTIASIGEQILSYSNTTLWIHQFITSRSAIPIDEGLTCDMRSSLPYNGEIEIVFDSKLTHELEIAIRIPSWTGDYAILVNDELMENQQTNKSMDHQTASGLNPFNALYYSLKIRPSNKTYIKIHLSMDITIIQPHPKVSSVAGKSTVSRGPLVFCLEQSKNAIDIFSATMVKESLVFDKEHRIISGKTTKNEEVIFTPYFRWANAGPTKMTVFTKIE